MVIETMTNWWKPAVLLPGVRQFLKMKSSRFCVKVDVLFSHVAQHETMLMENPFIFHGGRTNGNASTVQLAEYEILRKTTYGEQ